MQYQLRKITPCLWFDDQAEEAASLYTSIFKDSKILDISRYTEVGQEFHGKEPGSVMVVIFELSGQTFTGLNGGPIFKFNEAMSLQIDCADQDEVDYFWKKLTEGGSEQPCGWLKDRFGVSWQVVARPIIEMMADSDAEKSKRATTAMFQQSKPDIAAVKRAFDGE